jgi:hypothetical protein
MIENIACMPVPKLGKKYFRNLNQLSFNEKDLRISQTALLKLAINSSEKNAINKVPQGKCSQEL